VLGELAGEDEADGGLDLPGGDGGLLDVISDAYDEVKTRTRQTGIATRDYAQEHPWTAAGVAVGALGLLAAYLLTKRN